MKKTSGTTPHWVRLVALGVTLAVALVGPFVLIGVFSQDRSSKTEVSQPKSETPAALSEPPPPVAAAPEDSQESAEVAVEMAEENVAGPEPLFPEKETGHACPNDNCAVLPEKLLADAFERGCKRIVVRPPTRVLTKEELVEVAVLVYGRLTCRHDMTFDWPGESIARGDETLYKQDLKGTPVFFRFGSR